MKSFSALPAAVRGAAWMVMGGVFLVLMAIDIRHLAPKFNVMEMIFIRSAISLCFMLPWAYKAGLMGLKTRRIGLHVFRNAIHYIGNLGWFLGVTLVKLADLSALQFTIPLFTIVMAALILHEKVGPHRWIATAIGFAGALIIIRPGYIPIETGTIAVVLSAFFYACSQIATKKLSDTDSPNLVIFYMGAVFVPISFGPAMLVWVTPGWQDAVPFLILGATGYMAHFCIIRSFTAADASFVTLFDFMRLPVSVAFGFVLFGEATEAWTWVGAGIIFCATYYITRRETRGRLQEKS